MSEVTDHLTASRTAHRDYRLAAGQIDKDGVVIRAPDDVAALAAITLAQTHREAAHKADPKHQDVAWKAEPHSLHAELMAFYAEYLQPVPAPPPIADPDGPALLP